jgi:hypothetical protein
MPSCIEDRLAVGLEHGVGLRGHHLQRSRKLDGLQAAVGQFNAFLLSEPGGGGAGLKEIARALFPSLVVNCRGVDHEFEVRSLWVAIWPDLE